MTSQHRSPRRSTRRGLSLTEVLIATFVMAVGLLSLASLIPVGMHEVAMANRAQNASHVGRQAWREIKVREWLRPRDAAGAPLWFRANATPIVTPPPLPVTTPDPPFTNLVTAPYHAFAIDPLMLSAAAVGTYPNVEYFPYVSAGNPATNNRLPRISLRASEYDPAPLLPASAMAFAAAERLFVASHDVNFDPVNPVTQSKGDRPVRVYQRPTNIDADAIPQSAGDYSWMITVNPSPADPGRLYTVSVVVFYKRALQLPLLSAADQRHRERVVRVTQLYGGGINGGDIQIRSLDAGESPRVKAGQWLMLFTGDTTNPNTPVRCSWYRITGADDDPTDGNLTDKEVTITGSDWPFAANVTYAALFDTVVGVYEKTIQLE